MTLIDDYSRHCTLKLLEKKSDAPQKIKDYLTSIFVQFQHMPVAIQTDNGTEFINNELVSWIEGCGMHIRPSAPYSPQQNGIPERYNRTLADLIRAMLLTQCIPKILWGTAALHAVYLRNRAFTRAISDRTPFERWHGKRPNVEHLQEFGIPVSILNEAVGRDKLDPCGEIHLFVGFEDGPGAIRYFDVKTRHVKLSRNYCFLPHCDNPPHFEGEHLDEDEVLWEQEKETSNAPLMIHIPQKNNVTCEEDNETQHHKHQKTKSAHPYINAEQSLYANVIVYAAFNEITLKDARASAEWPQWEKAIEVELDQLRKMGTWELVDLPEGRRAVGN
jgi:hypothetical protein